MLRWLHKGTGSLVLQDQIPGFSPQPGEVSSLNSEKEQFHRCLDGSLGRAMLEFWPTRLLKSRTVLLSHYICGNLLRAAMESDTNALTIHTPPEPCPHAESAAGQEPTRRWEMEKLVTWSIHDLCKLTGQSGDGISSVFEGFWGWGMEGEAPVFYNKTNERIKWWSCII